MGPKTPKGRSRSAKNALRHGLSLPVDSDPALSQEVAALARQIVGADATPEMQEMARYIAEAQVDLRRVRVLRHDLISRALSNPDYDSRTNWDKKLNTVLRIIRRCCRCEVVPEEEVKFISSKLAEPDRFTTIIRRSLGGFPRWTGMNGERCRGGNWRSGLSMQGEATSPKQFALTSLSGQRATRIIGSYPSSSPNVA